MWNSDFRLESGGNLGQEPMLDVLVWIHWGQVKLSCVRDNDDDSDDNDDDNDDEIDDDNDDDDDDDDYDKEDSMSPKYSLSRRVTAGESSTRNFLIPGVYNNTNTKKQIHRKCFLIQLR